MKTQIQNISDPTEKLNSRAGNIQFRNNRPEVTKHLKTQHMANPTIQRQENKTGMPDNLKSGIENLSGMDMSDVKVHYNSSQPAKLQAHAFAQGNQIHLGAGQEKHLPHEAWHVVQQKQGRVAPTRQLKGKVNINDDNGLEREADLMGVKALQANTVDSPKTLDQQKATSITTQRVLKQGDLHGTPQQVIENYLRKNKKYELLLLPEHKVVLSDLIRYITNKENPTEYYIPGSEESTDGRTSIDLKLNEALLKTIQDQSETTGLKLENKSKVNNPWIFYNQENETIEIRDDNTTTNDGFVPVAQTCSVMSIVWLNSGKTRFNDLTPVSQIKFANILIHFKSQEDQLQWVQDEVKGAGSYVIYNENHFYAAKKVDDKYSIYDSNDGSVNKYGDILFNKFISNKTVYPLIITNDLAESAKVKRGNLTGLLNIEAAHSILHKTRSIENINALDQENETQMDTQFKSLILSDPSKKAEYETRLKSYSVNLVTSLLNAEGSFEDLRKKDINAKYDDFKLAIKKPLNEFADDYHQLNYYIQQKLAFEINFKNAYYEQRSVIDYTPYTQYEQNCLDKIQEAEKHIAHYEPKLEVILKNLNEEVENYVHRISGEDRLNKLDTGIKKLDFDPLKNLQVFVDKQKWLTSTLNKMLEDGVEKLMNAETPNDKKEILLGMMKFKNAVQRYIQSSLDTYIQMKQNNAAEAIKNQNSLATVELIHKSISLAAGALSGGLGIWEHLAKKDSPTPGIELGTTSIPSVTYTSENPHSWTVVSSGQLGVTANLTGGLGSAQVAVDVVKVYTASSTMVDLLFSVVKAYYGKQEPVAAEQAKYTLLLEQASMQMTQEMSLVESTYRNALETVKTFAAIK